jgi:ubiquinone/menaquinone biosynthesis C-methylase UbiE
MNRYNTYQKQIYGDFGIKSTDKVLDIGIGNDPFPLATHLADKFIEPNKHNNMLKLITDDRPFTIVDVEDMSVFKDKEFDFVYCSHVIEHCKNPINACKELIRISKRGYIETPSKTCEIMFGDNIHEWYIIKAGNKLYFEKIKKTRPFGDLIYRLVDIDFNKNNVLTPIQSFTLKFYEKYKENLNLMFTNLLWNNDFNMEIIS